MLFEKRLEKKSSKKPFLFTFFAITSYKNKNVCIKYFHAETFMLTFTNYTLSKVYTAYSAHLFKRKST